MARKTTDYRGLTESSRMKLLHAVQREPGQQLKDLAATTGLHLNTVRDHLNVLESEGLIHRQPVDTGRRGRPPMEYHPVADHAHSKAAQQRANQASARGELLRSIAPEDDHGQHLAADAQRQLDVLYEHLDDAGMAPVMDSQNLTVDVQPCIYQELLETERPLVCSVHAKLVRQQLAHVDGPLTLQRLHPFTTQHSCLLILSMNTTTDDGDGDGQVNQNQPGISANRPDTELAQFALAAQKAANATGSSACQL